MPPHAERDLQRLLAEESFVRELAQQLVVGDADEVVQQTWLRAVQQGGRGIERPRHWLARVVRNLAANLRRDHRRRQDRERSVEAHALVPSSSALAEREECRRALVAAVDALPPPLRTVVLLRWFDGHPPRDIAAALGVSAATVSTQLQRALVLLRERLDQAHGSDRRAWLVPLVPFVARPPLPPVAQALPLTTVTAAPALLIGAIAMTTKTKFAWSAAALLLAAGAWLMWPGLGPPLTAPSTVAGVSPSELVAAPLGDRVSGLPIAPTTSEREVATPPSALATTGTLIVHVRHGDDHAPAVGTMMTLQRSGSDPRYDGWRQRTDATGTARYENVLPGRLYVGDNNGAGQRVELVAGQTAEIELELDVGITVTGLVVDGAHVPVAGAEVEVTMMARLDTFPDVVAVTGADGRFAVRACPYTCLVGARARGYTASTVKFLHGKKGNTAEVELVLGPDGGAVDGLVVDAAGKPIANAVVIVGKGELSGIPGRDHIPPFAALARSDAEGRFLAIGILAGEQPVQARAPGFAPWQGKCEVAAGNSVTLRIELPVGGIIRGNVRDATGKAIDRAEVEIGQWNDLAHFRSRTAADGSFALTGLPLGELRLRADHDDFGKAEQLVGTTAEAAATCDLQLSRGLELKGGVVDPDGQPVGKVLLQCMAETTDTRWGTFAPTDAKGRFAIPNCPETGTISISVHAQGFVEFRQRGVDPRAVDLLLRLQREAPSTVRITARVVGPDGKPVANASVSASRQDFRGSSGLEATDNDGRFELGPMAPGVWRVAVQCREHPDFESEPRELAADATWDLGTITLVHGGTAQLRLVGPTPAGARFYVSNTAGRRSGAMTDEAGGHLTSSLAPGDYLVIVAGKEIAAQTVPFTIRAGVQANVDVSVQPGTAQRLRCELPAGTSVEGVSLRVLRGAVFVGRAFASVRESEPFTAEVWLAAGDYTVLAEAGALRGSAAFTVGAANGQPVLVSLR